MAVKYYAVRKGIKPGIYKDWNTCKAMVTGFSGAQYKSFTTLQEAEAYIKEDAETAQAGKNRKFMRLSMVHLTRRHMYTVMVDFLSMTTLKKYCRGPAKMRTWLP